MNQPVPPHRDSALRYTAMLAHDLLQGRRPAAAATVHAPFPTQIAADEQLWSIGPFQLFDLRAPGDGTYVEDRSWLFATGALGLALSAGVLAARKVGNDRRRREAEEALVPRWMEIAAGDLYTGTHGFYMHSPNGLWSWSWPHIQSADVMGPGWLRFTGEGRGGQVSWSIVSDWAELLFLAWAMARHPRHPQLMTGSWWPGVWPGGPTAPWNVLPEG
jgi:hypothetical protein